MQKCFASRVDDSRVWSRSWNGDHPPDHRRVLRGEPVLPLVNSSAPPFGWDSIKLLVVEVWIRACESIPGRSLVDTNPVGELNQTPISGHRLPFLRMAALAFHCGPPVATPDPQEKIAPLAYRLNPHVSSNGVLLRVFTLYFLSPSDAEQVAERCSTFVAVKTGRPPSVVLFPVSLTV